MQVWATASARAPMVGGVRVVRMASSSAPFHRRTGLTPTAGAGGALVAAARPSGRAPTVSASPTTAHRLRAGDRMPVVSGP